MFTAKQIQSLNELELEVYNYVTSHRDVVPFMRIRELADNTHVSTTTILHFCKKVGCDGYSEFRATMKSWQDSVNLDTTDLPSTMQNFVHHMESKKMKLLMEEASSLIACHDEILFIGIGNSGYICEYAARYFSNMGKFSLSVTEPFFPLSQARNILQLGVILSVSGSTTQILDFQKALRSFNSPTIAITSDATAPVAKQADIVLPYPVSLQKSANNVDFTTQAPAILIVEELARLVQKRLLE